MRVEDRPTAKNEHPIVFCQCVLDGNAFKFPEMLFSMFEEDVRNLQTRDLLDVEIGVAKRRTEAAREQSTNRALACSGRTHEDNQRRHRSVHDQGVEVTTHIAAHLTQ